MVNIRCRDAEDGQVRRVNGQSPVVISAKVTAPEGTSYYGQWSDTGSAAWTGTGTVGVAQYSQWSQAGEFDNFTADDEVTLFTPPTVSIEANVGSVNEGSSAPAAYTLRRTGSTSGELRVIVAIHGSAGMDDLDDYTPDPLPQGVGNHWYTIPAGQDYLEIGLNASADNLVEGDESSIIQLLPGSGYAISGTGEAGVKIGDNPPRVSLDVDGNGSTDGLNDGFENYLPGYVGSEQVLTADQPQTMYIMVEGLVPGSSLDFDLLDVSNLPGLCSNANANFGQLDDPDVWFEDENGQRLSSITVFADSNGVVAATTKVGDFGAKAKVKVSNGQTVIAEEALGKDTDADGLADKWEQDVAGNLNLNANSDEDKNKGNANGGGLGDRFPALDEFRGFIVIGRHIRTSPVEKDLFVFSPDHDPFLAIENNADGLNDQVNLGPETGAGMYADTAGAIVHVIRQDEFDAADATLGDVNFNSPNPLKGKRQKRVWVIADSGIVQANVYGRWTFSSVTTRGPNRVAAQDGDAGRASGKKAALVVLGAIRRAAAYIDGDGTASSLPGLEGELFNVDVLRREDPNLPEHPDYDNHIYGADKTANRYRMWFFKTSDQVYWYDNPNAGQTGAFDEWDALWYDSYTAKDNGTDFDVKADGKFTDFHPIPNTNIRDEVILDVHGVLRHNLVGIVPDKNSDLRYVDRSPPGSQHDRYFMTGTSTIFTTRFNRDVYARLRDAVIAHEALGHPMELGHDAVSPTMMLHQAGLTNHTAFGTLYRDQEGKTKLVWQTGFNAAQLANELQLREA